MHFLYNDAVGKLVLRLAAGGLILFHGLSKLFNPSALEGIAGMVAGVGLPAALGYAVILGEVIGPLMILLGVFSRIGGLLVVINMLFAIYLAHLGDIFALTQHGGWAIELQVYFLLGGLAVVFLGSGRYALRPD